MTSPAQQNLREMFYKGRQATKTLEVSFFWKLLLPHRANTHPFAEHVDSAETAAASEF